jgi:hypothetical protein
MRPARSVPILLLPTATVQGPGRPALIIQHEQIEFLRELHFSWAKITQILCISESMLR